MSKVHLKTDQEIKIMAEGGAILKKIFKEILSQVIPGITTLEIEKKVEALLKKYGVEASFKKVKNYSWATCICINEQIVHTPPSGRILKTGDLVTIDLGVYHKGYHTDSATTICLSSPIDSEKAKFLQVGKEALQKAIKKAVIGARIGDISQGINNIVTKNGYFIVHELVGHGVGRELHEEPMIPGFLDQPINKTLEIKKGMVLAIEVIYSMGTEEIAYEKDSNWSIITADSSLSACFEHTIAVLDEKPLILT